MQNGRGQGQSRHHGSKVESTGTNCHVHLPLTAWNPKPAVPHRREGSALDAELHVCPAQDSESQQELEKLWAHWLPHTQVDRIIFCVFLEVDFKIYKKKMSELFPADENGPQEKPSAKEMEGQSQEADGASAATVPNPSSEEAAEVCKHEAESLPFLPYELCADILCNSTKDDNITKENEVTDHSVCGQDHPNGQKNDSMKNEIKIEAESQSSYMETEELSLNQEDITILEQQEVIPLTDDQEGKEGEKAQGEDTPRVPVKSEGSGDTESSTSPDVEMNNQVDSVNDPTESQQED
ncbi:PREDICTED: O-acetyl-ADP-ribose deacetylase MACROD2-like [Lipotes vexillifer]|uniref:O-acetyl-ADP-ribose deacetylase MACROD2-like n=1 Tax=Lipotes vexillifer TaxID=118797 RepID=A0A340WV76_LIPVE|nr:PREDICTED: O-acetyl-ADP-ribose deacetylase MACROD2-like [Lipotes vexillifer]